MQPWAVADPEQSAITWAIVNSLPDHLAEVSNQILPATERARQQVRHRLTAEINFQDARYAELLDQEAAGRQLKTRPETALKRARDLERRLDARMVDLTLDAQLRAHPPTIAGMALVIPQGLLDRLTGKRTMPAATYAKDTAEVDRRAVAAVMAAERSLGRTPVEMPHNNPGFDIRSTDPDGQVIRIEVKGRIDGAEDFQITRREVLTAKNLGDAYRLAIVKVSQDGADHDELRYLTRPFDLTGTDDFSVTRFTIDWAARWKQGGPPL